MGNTTVAFTTPVDATRAFTGAHGRSGREYAARASGAVWVEQGARYVRAQRDITADQAAVEPARDHLGRRSPRGGRGERPGARIAGWRILGDRGRKRRGESTIRGTNFGVACGVYGR